MRSLIIFPSDLIGGAENVLLQVSQQLISVGADVTIICLSKRSHSKRLTELNANVVIFRNERESIGVVKFLWYVLKGKIRGKSKFDFSMSSHTHCNAMVSLFSKLRLIKIENMVLRESTNVFDWFSGYKLFILKIFYRLYSSKAKIVFQTPYMQHSLVSNLPYFSSYRLLCLRNPIDSSRILNKSNLDIPFVDNQLVNEKISLIAVGRFVSEKSFDVLLQAVAILPDNYVLNLVGDGPLRSDIEALILKLGIGERVKLLGFLENPYSLMKKSDIGVISSQLEGFPNVLHEFLLLVSKVVCTQCTEGIESIPGVFSCRINSPIDLANKILESQAYIFSDIEKENINSYISNVNISGYLTALLNKDLS